MRFSERLWVPWWWWLLGVGFIGTGWFAVALYLNSLWATAVSVPPLLAFLAAFTGWSATEIKVDDAGLSAGGARIEPDWLGEVRALSPSQTKRILGVEAEASAWHVVRPYLTRSVRIEVKDPADPHPYWIVSSRSPDELAAAVSALIEEHTK